MLSHGLRQILYPRPVVSGSWTPLSLGSSLIGWWKADIGVTLSGSDVTAVADQSGNGKTLTNTGKVVLNATGFNGLPTFDFQQTDLAGLSNTSFTGLGTGTTGSAFIVGQMRSATAAFAGAVSFLGNSGGSSYLGAGSADWISRDNASNAILTTQGGASRGSTAISLSTNYRLGAIFDGANLTHYVNNSAGSSGADTHAWAGGVTNIGIGNFFTSGVFAGATGAAWHGAISEIVITNTALSSGDRLSLDDYFKVKWGL